MRQTRSSAIFTLAAVLWFADSHTPHAATSDTDHELKRSPQAEPNAKLIRDAITSEATTLPAGHWAGRYYGGDGLGVNQHLELAPRAGFLFEWHGCMGLYDRNFGPVHVEETTPTAIAASDADTTPPLLRLQFTLPNSEAGFQGIAEHFVPIRWGDRTYLASPEPPGDNAAPGKRSANGIIRFCNDVNSGREPRRTMRGNTLLRQGDEKKPVTGKPTVPPAYRAYLLDDAVTATILSVSPTSERRGVGNTVFRDTTATVDHGRAVGLLPGLVLYVHETGSTARTVTLSATVTLAGDHQSEILFTDVGHYNPAPQPGWKLSTSPPWRRALP